MNDLLLLLTAATVIVWSVELPLIFLRRPMVKELRNIAVRDVNRNRFGIIRTRPMELARKGDVDVKDELFQSVYHSLTILMRNPNDYGLAAGVILNLEPKKDRKVFYISVREREVLIHYAESLDRLCRDYSRLYRIFSWLLDWSTDRKSPPLWVITHVERRSRIARAQKARKQLQELCSPAAA